MILYCMKDKHIHHTVCVRKRWQTTGLPEKLKQTYLNSEESWESFTGGAIDKYCILAGMETDLFGNSPEHRDNRDYQLTLLEEIAERLRIQQVIAFRFKDDMPEYTGKEYFDRYLHFLQIIHSDHQGLQRLKVLLGDDVDFHNMEVDHYACGFGCCYHKRLYMRSLPAEEIVKLVDTGPNIVEQVSLKQWSPMSIWSLYLLYGADDWIQLNGADLCRANDIVCQDHWRPISSPGQGVQEPLLPFPDLVEGYTIPYPSVRMTDNQALIHYVCHWQHDNRYEDLYVVVTRKGDKAQFVTYSVPNLTIMNVKQVDNVCY